MNKEIDIKNVILSTERLVLRAWKESDLEDFYEYAKVDGVGQMAGWQPHKSIEESRMILQSFIKNKNDFAILYNNKVIGSLGIERYEENMLLDYNNKYGRELGFVLSKDYWGNGFMPEAVNSVINYLFEEVKLDFIVCTNFKGNYQSQRVKEKCGFTYAFDQTILINGKDKKVIEVWLKENKK